MHPRYDALATALPIARLLALVGGFVIVACGFFYLFTERRRTLTLIRSLVGALAGSLLAAAFAPPGYEVDAKNVPVRALIIFGSMALGAAVLPVVLALRDTRDGQSVTS